MEKGRTKYFLDLNLKYTVMKNLIAVVASFGFLIFLSCNNSADKNEVVEDSTEVVQSSSWIASLNDSTGHLEMKKNEAMGPDSLTATSVINYLNTQNPNVRLEFVRTSNDTLFVRIPEAMYLTQQMGSTGPTMFFAGAVYNLTEIPGITHVHFNFEEGDHASPGTLNRESFKNE
jgi:hypothetical protein